MWFVLSQVIQFAFVGCYYWNASSSTLFHNGFYEHTDRLLPSVYLQQCLSRQLLTYPSFWWWQVKTVMLTGGTRSLIVDVSVNVTQQAHWHGHRQTRIQDVKDDDAYWLEQDWNKQGKRGARKASSCLVKHPIWNCHLSHTHWCLQRPYCCPLSSYAIALLKSSLLCSFVLHVILVGS